MRQHFLNKLLLVSFFSTGIIINPCFSQAKYKSVSKLLLEISDYTVEDKTLMIISDDPKKPAIEIITGFVGDHPESNILEFNRKGIILTAYHCFHYSNIDEITITSTPQKITFTTPGNRNTKKVTLLPSFRNTVKITRNTAAVVAKKFLGISNFKDLFDSSFDLKGIPNRTLKEAMYNYSFYKELTK